MAPPGRRAFGPSCPPSTLVSDCAPCVPLAVTTPCLYGSPCTSAVGWTTSGRGFVPLRLNSPICAGDDVGRAWRSPTQRAWPRVGAQRPSEHSSAPPACPGSPGGGQPEGALLPEPVLVALAQVAGASVQTGALDAGVDGHGAVFALGEEEEARLGRLSPAAMTQETREFPASSGMRPGGHRGPGTSLQCDLEKATGSPCHPPARRGGMGSIQETGLPEFTPVSPFCSQPQGKCFGHRTTWFTFQLHLFLVG